MISQNIVWLAWPPPLLMTAWRMPSGTWLISRSSCSIGLLCRAGCRLQGLVQVVHVRLVVPAVVDLHRHLVDGRLQGVGGIGQRAAR